MCYDTSLTPCTLSEANIAPENGCGWNTIVSFWGPAYFQGRLLLVSGRVNKEKKNNLLTTRWFFVTKLHPQTLKVTIPTIRKSHVFTHHPKKVTIAELPGRRSLFHLHDSIIMVISPQGIPHRPGHKGQATPPKFNISVAPEKSLVGRRLPASGLGPFVTFQG